MAKKRHYTKKRKPYRRGTIRGIATAAPKKRKKATGNMTLMDGLKHIAVGVGGAIVVTKFGDLVPIKTPFYRNLVIVGGSLLLIRKPGLARSFGIGSGIAAGTMIVAEKAPKLLDSGKGDIATKTMGRLSKDGMAQMEAAARMRKTLNGYRDRTMMGTGGGGDYPPITGDGDRFSVIMGAGNIM